MRRTPLHEDMAAVPASSWECWVVLVLTPNLAAHDHSLRKRLGFTVEKIVHHDYVLLRVIVGPGHHIATRDSHTTNARVGKHDARKTIDRRHLARHEQTC